MACPVITDLKAGIVQLSLSELEEFQGWISHLVEQRRQECGVAFVQEGRPCPVPQNSPTLAVEKKQPSYADQRRESEIINAPSLDLPSAPSAAGSAQTSDVRDVHQPHLAGDAADTENASAVGEDVEQSEDFFNFVKVCCDNGHELQDVGTTLDNGWSCSGMPNCKSGITGFHQTTGMNRYRCKQCDFDFCEECWLHRARVDLENMSSDGRSGSGMPESIDVGDTGVGNDRDRSRSRSCSITRIRNSVSDTEALERADTGSASGANDAAVCTDAGSPRVIRGRRCSSRSRSPPKCARPAFEETENQPPGNAKHDESTRSSSLPKCEQPAIVENDKTASVSAEQDEDGLDVARDSELQRLQDRARQLFAGMGSMQPSKKRKWVDDDTEGADQKAQKAETSQDRAGHQIDAGADLFQCGVEVAGSEAPGEVDSPTAATSCNATAATPIPQEQTAAGDSVPQLQSRQPKHFRLMTQELEERLRAFRIPPSQLVNRQKVDLAIMLEEVEQAEEWDGVQAGTLSLQCNHFDKGTCRKGDRCWFSHGSSVDENLEDQVDQAEETAPTAEDTTDAQASWDNVDELTSLLHARGVPRSQTESRNKPELVQMLQEIERRLPNLSLFCHDFALGQCRAGEHCWFTHDSSSEHTAQKSTTSSSNMTSVQAPDPKARAAVSARVLHVERGGKVRKVILFPGAPRPQPATPAATQVMVQGGAAASGTEAVAAATQPSVPELVTTKKDSVPTPESAPNPAPQADQAPQQMSAQLSAPTIPNRASAPAPTSPSLPASVSVSSIEDGCLPSPGAGSATRGAARRPTAAQAEIAAATPTPAESPAHASCPVPRAVAAAIPDRVSVAAPLTDASLVCAPASTSDPASVSCAASVSTFAPSSPVPAASSCPDPDSRAVDVAGTAEAPMPLAKPLEAAVAASGCAGDAGSGPAAAESTSAAADAATVPTALAPTSPGSSAEASAPREAVATGGGAAHAPAQDVVIASSWTPSQTSTSGTSASHSTPMQTAASAAPHSSAEATKTASSIDGSLNGAPMQTPASAASVSNASVVDMPSAPTTASSASNMEASPSAASGWNAEEAETLAASGEEALAKTTLQPNATEAEIAPSTATAPSPAEGFKSAAPEEFGSAPASSDLNTASAHVAATPEGAAQVHTQESCPPAPSTTSAEDSASTQVASGSPTHTAASIANTSSTSPTQGDSADADTAEAQPVGAQVPPQEPTEPLTEEDAVRADAFQGMSADELRAYLRKFNIHGMEQRSKEHLVVLAAVAEGKAQSEVEAKKQALEDAKKKALEEAKSRASQLAESLSAPAQEAIKKKHAAEMQRIQQVILDLNKERSDAVQQQELALLADTPDVEEKCASIIRRLDLKISAARAQFKAAKEAQAAELARASQGQLGPSDAAAAAQAHASSWRLGAARNNWWTDWWTADGWWEQGAAAEWHAWPYEQPASFDGVAPQRASHRNGPPLPNGQGDPPAPRPPPAPPRPPSMPPPARMLTTAPQQKDWREAEREELMKDWSVLVKVVQEMQTREQEISKQRDEAKKSFESAEQMCVQNMESMPQLEKLAAQWEEKRKAAEEEFHRVNTPWYEPEQIAAAAKDLEAALANAGAAAWKLEEAKAESLRLDKVYAHARDFRAGYIADAAKVKKELEEVRAAMEAFRNEAQGKRGIHLSVPTTVYRNAEFSAGKQAAKMQSSSTGDVHVGEVIGAPRAPRAAVATTRPWVTQSPAGVATSAAARGPLGRQTAAPSVIGGIPRAWS